MMGNGNPPLAISPRAGVLLTQIAETADMETALWKVLSDYVNLKMERIKQDIRSFESKWGMTFEEFSERGEAGALDHDFFSYDVESDFWEWEKAHTLYQHYEALQTRWM